MSASLTTQTSGAKTGTVTLNYETAGAVGGTSNGLGTASAGSQTIALNGAVYQAAAGAIQTPTLNFGNVQVGQPVTQNLTIRNTATGAAGFVEDLNASFGSSTDLRITGTGTLAGILAGTNSTGANGTMTVNVNTSSAGNVNGSIDVLYQTAGAVSGVSNGLGTAAAGSESYAVAGAILQGNVIDQARPVINGVANAGAVNVALGSVRINSTAGQTLTVLNESTGNPQAALNASISSNGAPVTASGGFSGLLPGNTSPGQSGIGTLQVGIDTSAAGARSGTATVALVSDITAYGNCDPCTLNLPSQAVNVSADVYRLANPTLNTPVVTIAARVGDAVAANRAVSISNTSPDIYTEGLKVGITSASGNAQHNGGSIANLAAQGTNSTAIQVGLASTAAAGQSNGVVNLRFDSTGAGTTGAPDTDAQTASGVVSVIGHIYQRAVGAVVGAIDFGIVRVGQLVGVKDATVSNSATQVNGGAYNDTLAAQFASGSVGKFTTSGSPGGIAAGGGTNAAGSMTVGLDTAQAGSFSETQQVNFRGQNSEMADDLTLSSGSLIMTAQVNNWANAVFGKSAGAGSFDCSGLLCTLNLGDVEQGSGLLSTTLFLRNDVAAPADSLKGLFDLSLVDDFSYGGWIDPNELLAGASLGGLALSFDPLSLGAYTDTIYFDGLSFNSSDTNGQALSRLALALRANVIEQGGGTVPEPGTLALILLSLTGAALGGRTGVRRLSGRQRNDQRRTTC
jgi:hypothetical protein